MEIEEIIEKVSVPYLREKNDIICRLRERAKFDMYVLGNDYVLLSPINDDIIEKDDYLWLEKGTIINYDTVPYDDGRVIWAKYDNTTGRIHHVKDVLAVARHKDKIKTKIDIND